MVLNMKRRIRGRGKLERMLGMVLLFIALEALPVMVHGQTVTNFTVCTLHRPPMATCSVEESPEEYSGLSLAVFRDAARALGWEEGVNYNFKCLNGSVSILIDDLLENGECDAGIASITITTERKDSGVKFAYPYLKGSIGIMAEKDAGNIGGWNWVRPFSTDLWIAIIITMFFLPAIIYAIEAYSLKAVVRLKEDAIIGVHEASWQSLWTLMHGGTTDVTAVGARICVLCFSFSALILGSSYTANLAAFLTIQKIGAVNSIYDLTGLSTMTVGSYAERLKQRYPITPGVYNVSSIDDVFSMGEEIQGGLYRAFLYDVEVLQYVVANFRDCGVRLLSETYQPFDYGLAFAKDTSPDLVDAFSRAILALQESGSMEIYRDQFMMLDSPCLGTSSSNSDTEQITFKSVYGLWIIMAAGILVGALIMIGGRIYRIKYGCWASTAVKKDINDDNNIMPQHREHRQRIIQENFISLERSKSFALPDDAV